MKRTVVALCLGALVLCSTVTEAQIATYSGITLVGGISLTYR